MAGKGQILQAQVHVDTSTAEGQLNDWLKKSRTITVDVKANTSAIDKSVKALTSVAKAGEAAQKAVNGEATKSGSKNKTPDYITKAKKELIEVTKLQNSLGARRKTLTNALSGKSVELFTDKEVKGMKREVAQIESSLKQLSSLRGELNKVRDGKVGESQSERTLTSSMNAKLEGQQVLADTKKRISAIKETRDAYRQYEKDKANAQKTQLSDIKKARSELIELTKLQDDLSTRRSALNQGLNGKSNALLTGTDTEQIKKEVSQIESAMKDVASAQKSLERIRDGKVASDQNASILSRSSDTKSDSKRLLAETKSRVKLLREAQAIYNQDEKDKANALKSEKKQQQLYDNNIKKANSELTAQMQIGSQLQERQKLLKDGLSGDAANMLSQDDAIKVAGHIREVNQALEKNKALQKDLRNARNLKPDQLSSVLDQSAVEKNISKRTLTTSKEGVASIKDATAAYKEMQKAEEAAAKASEKIQNKVIGFDKVGNRLSEYFATYGAQIQKNVGLYNQWMTLMNKVQTGGFASVQEANRAFATFRMNARAAGVEVESIGSKLERTFGSRVRSALAGQGVYMIQSALRGIVQNAIEVDTAMTELKKVTDASDAEYSQFLTNASDRAQNLGATLKDVVSATADYARLGYDIPDATKLADSAILYLNVGDDVESMDQATKSLISTMQGFGIAADDSMTIVDKQHCPL